MKVLKFGGSSVANAKNIEKVIEIIRGRAGDGQCAVVLSALQTTTDKLIESGRSAAAGSDSFLNGLAAIQENHEAVVRKLFADQVPDDLTRSLDSAMAGR